MGNLLHHGDSATWNVLGAPAGPAVLSLRYSNVVDAASARAGPRTVDLVVNGHLVTTLVAAPTDSAHPWSTLTTTASLTAGTNSVEVRVRLGRQLQRRARLACR